MLKYREPDTNKKSYDISVHCNYCGAWIETQKEYCSNKCKEKNSVWHTENDL